MVVDIREDDYCLDPDAAAGAIGTRTHALMPVHLYGQMADLRALTRVAEQDGIALVEDACQAHGASGTATTPAHAGAFAAFSFYPGKNLGAAGDAGALVTRDPEVAARMRALREHGQTAKYIHAMEGWTSRLDTVQALVLMHKLPLLDEWNSQRRAAAAFYAMPSPASVTCSCRRSRRAARPSGISMSSARRIPRAWRRPFGPGHRHRTALPVPGAPDGCVCASGSRPRRVPGRRGARVRVPLAADVPGDHRGAARSGLRGGSKLLRWLRHRRTTRRTVCLNDVSFGEDVGVGPFTNIYGCKIGAGSRIGPFVEIQRDVRIGERCKIQSHTFICSGVEIDDEVFIGHGVMFINDKRPRATTAEGSLQERV